MNERIKELAEQAGIDEWWDSGSERREGLQEHLEKLAELIVRKCADIGRQYADGNYEVPNQILEYFGMEE
jgi:hypothetical protein